MKMDNFIESSLREEQKDQNLTQVEYDRIFSQIQEEVTLLDRKKSRRTFKYPKHLSDFMQVAAVIMVLILVPALSINYRNNIREKSLQDPGIVNIPKVKLPEGTSEIEYDTFNRMRILITDAPLREDIDHGARQIKLLRTGHLVMVQKAVKDREGKVWLQVNNPLDSSTVTATGWIKEGESMKMLSVTAVEGSGIKNSEVKSLMEKYLQGLTASDVPEDRRLLEFRLHEARLESAVSVSESVQDFVISARYDIKPYNSEKFSLIKVKMTGEDGWIKDLNSPGSAIVLGKTCFLSELYLNSPGSESAPTPKDGPGRAYKLAIDILNEKGYVMMTNSGVSGKITLPDKFSGLSKDKEVLGLYLAYCAEVSKAPGYDFSKYRGASLYLYGGTATKKDDIASGTYNFVVLIAEDIINGFWIEKRDSSLPAKTEIMSVDGRTFGEVVKDKKQWLKDNSFSIKPEEMESILSQSIAEFRNPLIFKLLQMDAPKTEDERLTQRGIKAQTDSQYINENPEIEIRSIKETEEIGRVVFNEYLKQFKEEKFSDAFRLEDYKIEKVEFRKTDGKTYTFIVQYSVKSIDAVNKGIWMAGNGRDGEDGWVNNKSFFIDVSKSNDIYKLVNKYTG